LLLAGNEFIFYSSLITQPVSHAFSCLFSSRHNNQPFRNAREKIGKQSFKWAERLTEMGEQIGTIELGRAGNLTRQISDRTGFSKNERAVWKKQKISAITASISGGKLCNNQIIN
jgi:hypothetical protein